VDIQKSFDDSIRNSTLPDAAIDWSEAGLDALLKNELLKQVPIVKLFLGAIQTGVNVHDKLFLKKVVSFLQNIDDIGPAERDKMINEIDQSKKHRLKVGEKLLYILDTCNDHESSERIAILFKAFLKRKITYDQYLEAASIVARLSQKELDLFLSAYYVYYIDDSANELMHTGLVFSETEEVAVDLNKIEQADWDDPPERYEADVSGGEVTIKPTSAGEIVFEVLGIGKKARLEQIDEQRQKREAEKKRSK
jgi:hypothetical protein